ncbi:NAD(P)-dependent oxidoreductase [Aurantimonas sp. VKM B-3413]|uniref:NAD(P)-dependent oxidoreductase n=1 Tax=Aurantimonas sp. VKM B-3413 TaxID=2779401 RepID=UPI001E3EEB92|nr:SDR family oxidoreductase [Aurantimonas sp. VKM B-3413]MCB8839930.1 SDR family oxidoreductase [Aurantimonas sp. VKM B-3413]
MEQSSAVDTVAAPRKLLVLGATGGTGRQIVAQAVERGCDVTVLARNAEKASGLDGARVVVGNALDRAVLRSALEGRDAVISALGTPASPFREVTLLSAATRILVDAMQAEKVQRLVAITGMGAGDSVGHGGFLFDRLIFPLLLRKVYADKNRQEAIIRASGLDWVLVRPSVLNDKPGGRPVRVLAHLAGFNGGTISRADVARFVLDQMEKDEWLHRSPLVTW